MSKFLLLYYSPVSAEEQMANATPEQIQAGMAPWMEWFGKLGSAVVDGGNPLAHGVQVTPSGASPSQSHVSGYTFVEAADIEAAKKMVEGHPHFMMPGNTVEVLEVMPMM